MAESYAVDKAMSAPRQMKSKMPPKELAEIRLKPAEGGGVAAEHHFTSMEHKPEMHVFAAHEGAKLAAHLGTHMGIKGMAAGDLGKAENEDDAEQDTDE